MAHGVGLPALDLMALVPGLEIERSRAGCCGTAGTYGVKKEKYQIAMDVGRTLFDQVTESKPDFIIGTPRPAAGTSPGPPACPSTTRSRCSTGPMPRHEVNTS